MAIIIQPNQITVDHEELNLSPREDFTARGLVATRKLRCPWDDRFTLARDLMGFSFASGEDVIYRLPHLYPGTNNTTARTVRVAPFHDSLVADDPEGRIARYDHAELTVQYESGAGGDGGQTPGVEVFIEEDFSSESEYLVFERTVALDDSGSGGEQLERTLVTRLVTLLNWRVTQRIVPFIPQAALLLAGHANEAPVVARTTGIVFPAETLLYNGFQSRRNTLSDGTVTLDLAYDFAYKPTGWNNFWVPGLDDEQPMFDDNGTPLKRVKLGDFTWL